MSAPNKRKWWFVAKLKGRMEVFTKIKGRSEICTKSGRMRKFVPKVEEWGGLHQKWRNGEVCTKIGGMVCIPMFHLPTVFT